MTARLAREFQTPPVRGVVSAYLFGSHAAGREHRESDVYVAVLLDWNAHPTASARFEARLRFITHLGHALGSRAVDLVVLNDAPPHLTRRVMTEGRQIVNVDPELDHAARRTALLRAADLDPFLRRLRRINLQAMAR